MRELNYDFLIRFWIQIKSDETYFLHSTQLKYLIFGTSICDFVCASQILTVTRGPWNKILILFLLD